MRKQHWNLLLVGLALIEFVFFVLLARWVHKHPVSSTDVTISHVVQKRRLTFLDILSKMLSTLGSPATANTTALLIALALWKMHLRLEALMTAGLSLMSLLVRRVIQQIVHRPRPSKLLVRVDTQKKTPSFPSGHATASTAIWGWLITLIMLLLPASRLRKGVLAVVPALVILLVGPTRIYLGEHWASDVLGGYLLGSTWLGIALPLYFKLRKDRK
jgi:membrane-associated phospholipid phosphatase